MQTIKLISWNVSGLRAALKKGFIEYIKKENPDIFCLQETKAVQGQAVVDLPEYEEYWNSSKNKKGYSGTAVFTRVKPISVTYDMGIPEHDEEGRVITLEYDTFFLVTVYTPNSQRGLARLEYRQIWDKDFLIYLKCLEKTKPVILCGDMNVAYTEIDLARPKDNTKNAGFTVEERAGFHKYIDAGFIDTFRMFNKDPGHYTWWTYMANARARNIGWRIDYFLVSKDLKESLKSAFIRSEVMGSDHCPVGIEIKI